MQVFRRGSRPNLFIVGVPRSGTTSLFRYLKAHPQIFMSAEKEPLFFGTDLYDSSAIRDPDRYLQLFADAEDQRYVGEATPWYMYSQRAAAEIAAFAPDARILVSLRDPMEMLISLHQHHVFAGYEPARSFAEAFRGHLPAESQLSTRGRSFRSVVDPLEAGRYARQLERFFDACGRERVHVILFDDLKRDAECVYRNVLGFLGLKPAFLPAFERHNVQRRRSVSWLPPVQPQTIKALIPKWMPGGGRLHGLLARRRFELNAVEVRPAPIPPALRREIAATLRPEIDRVGRLIDRDLGHWLAKM